MACPWGLLIPPGTLIGRATLRLGLSVPPPASRSAGGGPGRRGGRARRRIFGVFVVRGLPLRGDPRGDNNHQVAVEPPFGTSLAFCRTSPHKRR